MKYTLFYVENCSPKKRVFKTLKALKSFIAKFKTDKENAYWLDFYTAGKITFLDW